MGPACRSDNRSMYDFEPGPARQALREEIIAFARDHLNEGVAGRDRDGYFCRRWWENAARIGLPGLAIPEQYGGRGLDPLSVTLALEALGYACRDNGMSFALSAHLLACVVPLWLYGSEELRREYLPGLCQGQWVAANAMSEPEGGSDAFSMRTVGVESAGGFRIKGTKTFVSNGPVADQVLLYAATAPGKGQLAGITAFWLDTDRLPLRRSGPLDTMGLRSCPLGELYLEEILVEDRFVVGTPNRGALVFHRSMDWERTCLAGCHLGTIQWLLERAVRHLRGQSAPQGTTTGRDRQAAAHALARLRTKWEAARWLAYATAWKLGQGQPVSREAAMTKWTVSELLKEATGTVTGLLGREGTTNDDLERTLRDAVSSTLYSGTSEIQLNIIAQSMGC
ncbi:MAG: hypothetical protein RLY31_1942 [Bacteroidota bacterium]